MGAYGREMGLDLMSMGVRGVAVHGQNSHGNSHETVNNANTSKPVTYISYVDLRCIFRYLAYRLYASLKIQGLRATRYSPREKEEWCTHTFLSLFSLFTPHTRPLLHLV